MFQRPSLKELQTLPLSAKVAHSLNVISQALAHFDNQMYVSFSGGKDSTVLLHLVRKIKPDIKAVFCNTGLEWPEIVYFVRKTPNVEIIRPAMNFKQVIEKYGYPVINKEQSQFIHEIRTTKSEKLLNTRLNGNKANMGKLSKKWYYMLDAPFKISHKCCDVMKKTPFKKYEKITGLAPFIGTMAGESRLRAQQWEKYTCNAFEKNRPTSNPLSIWNDADIWEYIRKFKLPYCKIYDEPGIDRTGCVICMYGIHKDEIDKFSILDKRHPKMHNLFMNKLGCREVLNYTLKLDAKQMKLAL